MPRARSTLVDTVDGPFFADICDLLPAVQRKWATTGSRSFGAVKRVILDQQVPLASTSFCHRSGKLVPVRLGDISFAGIPCVDYSPMGLRKQTRGPTGLLVLVWARMIQVHRPRFVVIEEVPQFEEHGLTVLMSDGVLGSLYVFSHGIMNPRSLGLPVSRPRLYVIGVLRGFAAIEGRIQHSRSSITRGCKGLEPISFLVIFLMLPCLRRSRGRWMVTSSYMVMAIKFSISRRHRQLVPAPCLRTDRSQCLLVVVSFLPSGALVSCPALRR